MFTFAQETSKLSVGVILNYRKNQICASIYHFDMNDYANTVP